MMLDWAPLFLTFKLAAVTAVILLVLGVPLAYWLAYARSRLRSLVEPLVSLPMVLPPTVIGFYLLMLFSPNNALGRFLDAHFGITVVFSFLGLVIGSVLAGLPYMVNPVKTGFEHLPCALREASYSLGKSRTETFFRVLLPNIRPAIITGTVMSFAHTVGEFGVVLMIGGNIPGQTRTASIAIFSEAESMNFTAANAYALVLVAISFVVLFVLYRMTRTEGGAR